MASQVHSEAKSTRTLLESQGTEELKALLDEKDKAKIESDLAHKNIIRKIKNLRAAHFGAIFERLVRGCQKDKIAIWDRRCFLQDNVSCGTYSQCKAADSSKCRFRRFDSTHS